MAKVQCVVACLFLSSLIGCSAPSSRSQDVGQCDQTNPAVTTSGNMKMGINSHGDVINEVQIGIGVSTVLGEASDSVC